MARILIDEEFLDKLIEVIQYCANNFCGEASLCNSKSFSAVSTEFNGTTELPERYKNGDGKIDLDTLVNITENLGIIRDLCCALVKEQHVVGYNKGYYDGEAKHVNDYNDGYFNGYAAGFEDGETKGRTDCENAHLN